MATQAPPLHRNRSQSRESCRFVDAPEFHSLLLSRRKLERADDAESQLRGLVDLRTGARFVIEERKLAASIA